MIIQAVTQVALREQYEDCITKKKTESIPPYNQLSLQSYFHFLTPTKARICFQLRAGVYDIKVNRPYLYTYSRCRLCNDEIEDINHVINQCNEIERDSQIIDNIFNLSQDDTREMVDRALKFKTLVTTKEQSEI